MDSHNPTSGQAADLPPPSYNQATGGGYTVVPTSNPYSQPYSGPPYPVAAPYPQPTGGSTYPGGYDQGAPPIGFVQGHDGYKGPDGYNGPDDYKGPSGGYNGPAATQDDVRLINGNTGHVAANQSVDVTIINDTEGYSASWAAFSEKSVRRAFVRKVFLILMAQLAVTAGIISFFVLCEPVKKWIMSTGAYFYWMAYVVFLVVYIVLVCCPGVRRSYPTNVICLSIFTLALSYMAGTISSFHDTYVVMIAMGITAAVCLALVVFAIQTKIDFTMCSGILFVSCMVLFFFGIACIITGAVAGWQTAHIMWCVYAALGALLFSVFLVYDVQMVMGGHKLELSPEEYVFGALQIYLDVVYIFLMLLSLFGSKN